MRIYVEANAIPYGKYSPKYWIPYLVVLLNVIMISMFLVLMYTHILFIFYAFLTLAFFSLTYYCVDLVSNFLSYMLKAKVKIYDDL